MLEIIQLRRGHCLFNLYSTLFVLEGNAGLQGLMENSSLLVENPLVFDIDTLVYVENIILLFQTERLKSLDLEVDLDKENFPLIGHCHSVQAPHRKDLGLKGLLVNDAEVLALVGS
jgi:hypothetical protein